VDFIAPALGSIEFGVHGEGEGVWSWTYYPKIGAGISCGPASGESCVAWTGASGTLSNRVAAIPSGLVAISQAIQLKAFARITGRAKATAVLTLFGQ
jgi:hypothetical protein